MSIDILQQIDYVTQLANADLKAIKTKSAIENFRIAYLGKKGQVTNLLKSMRSVDPSDRPLIGSKVNELRAYLESELAQLKQNENISSQSSKPKKTGIDITLPGRRIQSGHAHPLRTVLDEIINIFNGIGFSVYMGPEIETDYYNFEALNVPANHPARDMQDTFYVENNRLLRTHTSPVQIHVMEKYQPPIAGIFPGTVYRRDNDVTHSPMFHQVEGLMVDTHITMGDLKGVLSSFCHQIFGGKLGVRFRPSYFPFTEPSAEVDIECVMCKGDGCRICKQSGWLEVLGCGMVDPNVFDAVSIDSQKYSGFAFGMGVERIAMLKYAINDIRLFFENDMRFLEQF